MKNGRPMKLSSGLPSQWCSRGMAPRLDPALEAVTHDEIGPAPKLAQKPLEPGEIVAIVGVAHDDITPSGGRDASAQRRTVAAFGNRHDARPAGFRDRLRPVAAAVVGDEHLTVHRGAAEKIVRLVDAAPDGLSLVQAWH